jgi:hypothetical protein
MKTRRVFAVLIAMVLVPFVLSWGTILLLPVALLLVPCVLLAAIFAVPALLVPAASAQPGAPRPQAQVTTTPAYVA